MQKNIDDQFQKAIGQLDSLPAGMTRNPESNWETIENLLQQDRRRRRGAWFWVAAAASVALLVGLGWYLVPDSKPEDNSVIAMADPDAAKSQSEADAPPAPPVEGDVEVSEEVPNSGMALLKEKNQEQTLGDFKLQSQNGAATVANGAISNQIVIVGSSITTQQQSPAYFANVPSDQSQVAFRGTYDRIAVEANKVPANAGYTFTWDFGDGTDKQSLKAGKYKVAVTDVNVCMTGKKGLFAKEDKNRDLQRFAVADSSIAFDPYSGEGYAETVENDYFATIQEPLSTFSIDVDRASYTNHRRFIESGQLPPKYSVRAEEFINYFDYQYPQPHGGAPFSILPEVTTCPWNPRHQLVRIALKGREVATENVPPSNIVFLLDVSGSMSDADKLPLLKQALGMLTEKLREQDKVSIVVYAGAAGLVLPPTSGSNKRAIMAALDRLEAGGSTAGGEGIELAYATAKQNFIKGANNRVILATDGDFNVGTSDEAGLERLIVKKREEGVFLSVLGFGEGNLQDSKMELLADKGNGNYNYIDSDREAHKVLVQEFGGTLYTIAKDVKIQVEFNPQKVESYRLVGYENRKLRNEDFANDKIDAGELGAGHTVTALYEVVPTGSMTSSQASPLKYQQYVPSIAAGGRELLTVKLRYKDPDGSVSKLIEEVLVDDGRNIAETTADFRWAVAVAEYALILRESEYKGLASFEQVLSLARSAMGRDSEGIRKEFVELVTKAAGMTQVAKRN